MTVAYKKEPMNSARRLILALADIDYIGYVKMKPAMGIDSFKGSNT